MNKVAVTQKDDTTVNERYSMVDWENYDFRNCRTTRDPIGPIYEQDMFAALKKSEGNLRVAADLLGRQRDTISRWLNANPAYKRVIDNIEDSALDDMESLVRAQALGGDPAQLRFLLQTKGKARGYTRQVEQTGRLAVDVEFGKIMESRMTEDQLIRIAREIAERGNEQARTIDGEFVEVEDGQDTEFDP